jgi:hypothetical protein
MLTRTCVDFAGCRAGFTDCDSFGQGFVARDTWSGCLDAPSYIAQGSHRYPGTIKHVVRPSMANRDVLTGHAHIGVCHD